MTFVTGNEKGELTQGGTTGPPGCVSHRSSDACCSNLVGRCDTQAPRFPPPAAAQRPFIARALSASDVNRSCRSNSARRHSVSCFQPPLTHTGCFPNKDENQTLQKGRGVEGDDKRHLMLRHVSSICTRAPYCLKHDRSSLIKAHSSTGTTIPQEEDL